MKIWDSVYDLDADDLMAFAAKHGVELRHDQDFESVEDAADFVCRSLGLDDEELKKIKAERSKRKASNPHQEELDELVLEHQRKRGGSYAESMFAVLKDRPDLKKKCFTPAGR